MVSELNAKLRIHSQKCICKFIRNDNGDLYFIGINELRFLHKDEGKKGHICGYINL